MVEFEDDWVKVYKILSFNNLISLNILEIMLLNKVRGLDFYYHKSSLVFFYIRKKKSVENYLLIKEEYAN